MLQVFEKTPSRAAYGQPQTQKHRNPRAGVDRIDALVDGLSSFSGDGFFNPYVDHCDLFDQPNAAEIRKSNLKAYLKGCLEKGASSMWVARDLGYRGGRRTGLPLTDEMHLSDAKAICGRLELARATKGDAFSERTASVVWRMLMSIDEPVVLWNAFPFHPHEQGNPQSNRQHTRKERAATLPFLEELRAIFRPERIFAIGRDAQHAMAEFDILAVPVRHPSYGGQSEFTATVQSAYSIV